MQVPALWCSSIGALIIRIGFWVILYYKCKKEPPKPYSNYLGPYSTLPITHWSRLQRL